MTLNWSCIKCIVNCKDILPKMWKNSVLLFHHFSYPISYTLYWTRLHKSKNERFWLIWQKYQRVYVIIKCLSCCPVLSLRGKVLLSVWVCILTSDWCHEILVTAPEICEGSFWWYQLTCSVTKPGATRQ